MYDLTYISCQKCSFSNANGLLVGFYVALALLFYEVGGSPLLKLQRFRVHKTNGAGLFKTISSAIAKVQILGWDLGSKCSQRTILKLSADQGDYESERN